MFIKSLNIENLRNLDRVGIQPHPRLNILFGGNGAGKTSVVESIVVLSRGRSFRTTQASELIGRSGSCFRVMAEAVTEAQKITRLGLERSGKHWRGRKDGADLSQLSQLTRVLPLVLMEPNSHLLVNGAPEIRRKFLDWGMFHVEHEFLDTYRRYARILKQRNAALRTRQESVLDGMDSVLSDLGEKLDAMRKTHCQFLANEVHILLRRLSPHLEGFSMEYTQGWSRSSLHQALADSREKDLARGVTEQGPHRGDLSMTFNDIPARNLLSRGEQKILSASLLLSQATILSKKVEQPLILLDDLASEFDERHFRNVLEHSLGLGGQVWVTGINRFTSRQEHKVFHVEHGSVREVV